MTIDDETLRGPYRAVRAIRARDDGPWPGILVRTTSGEARVLVDADVLGSGWTGWDAAADGHVLTPLDIARRVDGHDAVLPVCTERLEEFVHRRAARMPLSPGEAVTLGVSVLRGCAQLAAAPETTGEWWLDDAGRPLLATDASARRALEGSADVLEQVVVDPRLQRTWDTALRAVTAERVSAHELIAAEDALFALAAPEPLSTITLSPRPAAQSAARAHETRGHERAREATVDPGPRSMWQSLLHGVDDDLADSVSRATTAVWRRLRSTERPRKTTSRRAPWIVGGGVAVAVLVGGALWPTAGGIATADPRPTISPTTSGPSADPAAGADPAPPGDDAVAPAEGASDEDATDRGGSEQGASDEDASGDAVASDLAAVATVLLEERLACDGASDCLAAVIADPAAPPAGGVIDLPASERSVTLLDDFGDLAVLRVDALSATGGSQLVVILRNDEKWLLRDAHDVAQQPQK